jgi:hypothetical protein
MKPRTINRTVSFNGVFFHAGSGLRVFGVFRGYTTLPVLGVTLVRVSEKNCIYPG